MYRLSIVDSGGQPDRGGSRPLRRYHAPLMHWSGARPSAPSRCAVLLPSCRARAAQGDPRPAREGERRLRAGASAARSRSPWRTAHVRGSTHVTSMRTQAHARRQPPRHHAHPHLLDGAVGGEEAVGGGVQDGAARPLLLVAVQRVHLRRGRARRHAIGWRMGSAARGAASRLWRLRGARSWRTSSWASMYEAKSLAARRGRRDRLGPSHTRAGRRRQRSADCLVEVPRPPPTRNRARPPARPPSRNQSLPRFMSFTLATRSSK